MLEEIARQKHLRAPQFLLLFHYSWKRLCTNMGSSPHFGFRLLVRGIRTSVKKKKKGYGGAWLCAHSLAIQPFIVGWLCGQHVIGNGSAMGSVHGGGQAILHQCGHVLLSRLAHFTAFRRMDRLFIIVSFSVMTSSWAGMQKKKKKKENALRNVY